MTNATQHLKVFFEECAVMKTEVVLVVLVDDLRHADDGSPAVLDGGAHHRLGPVARQAVNLRVEPAK